MLVLAGMGEMWTLSEERGTSSEGQGQIVSGEGSLDAGICFNPASRELVL